jgi:hypothetical protein
MVIRNVTDMPLCWDTVRSNCCDDMSYRCIRPVEVPTISNEDVKEIVMLGTGDL